MLMVKERSKAHEPTVFFEHLVYKVPYWLWRGGIIPDGPGAYANNAPVHKEQLADALKQHGMFCAAVPNIYRRMAGLEIPIRAGLAQYDGSISAYFDGHFGKGYFHDVAVPFNMQRAIEWVEKDRAPVLLGKGYKGEPPHLQGHTALLLPSKYVLQSAFGEGLHWTRTIGQEKDYWDDKGVMVRADEWIDLEGERLKRQRAAWAK